MFLCSVARHMVETDWIDQSIFQLLVWFDEYTPRIQQNENSAIPYKISLMMRSVKTFMLLLLHFVYRMSKYIEAYIECDATAKLPYKNDTSLYNEFNNNLEQNFPTSIQTP